MTRRLLFISTQVRLRLRVRRSLPIIPQAAEDDPVHRERIRPGSRRSRCPRGLDRVGGDITQTAT